METIRFEDLELDAKIMRAITDMGFEAASPIQGQAIPLELQGGCRSRHLSAAALI